MIDAIAQAKLIAAVAWERRQSHAERLRCRICGRAVEHDGLIWKHKRPECLESDPIMFAIIEGFWAMTAMGHPAVPAR